MTFYPQAFFDGLTGILEQLVYATVVQGQLNQDYKASSFTTDFVKESIKWSVVKDTLAVEPGETSSTATLEIEIKLPRYPANPYLLVDTLNDFTSTLFSLHVADATNTIINRKPVYAQKSFTAKPPEYLKNFVSINHKITNTLERYIANLCLQIYAYKLWEVRHNYYSTMLRADIAFNDPKIAAFRPFTLPSRAVIDALIATTEQQLLSADYLPLVEIDLTDLTISAGANGDGNSGDSAVAQGDALGGDDPGNEGKLSDSVKDLLNESQGSFGTANNDPGTGNFKEEPTLAPC